MNDRILEITEARNVELGLGLQVTQRPRPFFLPFAIYFKNFIQLSAKHVPIFYIVSLLKFYFLWQSERKLIHK